MTALVGDPALRKLARLRLRGLIRRSWRRLKTPSGAIFALLGIGLAVAWLGSVGLAMFFGAGRVDAEGLSLPLVRVFLLGMFTISIAGNLTHRGLYLPAQEIERMLSAPIARPDVVRYRLQVGLAQSAIGGLLLGVVAAGRLPSPIPALFGALLFVATLSVSGQGFAMLIGALEARLSIRFLRNAIRIGGLVAGILILWSSIAIGMSDDGLGDVLRRFTEDPRVVALTLPFEPWVRLVTASSPSEFALWGAVALGIFAVLFEGVARLPQDFRELSLASSADVAARIRRVKQGGIASTRSLKSEGGLRPVPWVFGRGRRGALAWRKLAGIQRRAGVTLLFSIFLLSVLVFAATKFTGVTDQNRAIAEFVVGGVNERPVGTTGAVLIAVMGTFYLCSGLRFDFREDIERMDVLKAWPLSSMAVFGFTLLPEAVLIAGLICAALIVHALLVGLTALQLAPFLAFTPLAAWIWLALDNALFLVWPVRVVPGQDGAVQNMGRATMFLFVRGVVMLVMAGIGGGVGVAAAFVADQFHIPSEPVGIVAVWSVMLGFCFLTARAGGAALRRFDPASLS